MAASSNLPIPLLGGDEYDALTKAKRLHRFRPGERKAVKRSYQRRARRAAKAEALASASSYNPANAPRIHPGIVREPGKAAPAGVRT